MTAQTKSQSKLFLSCDLTGSTAFKQEPQTPQSPWQKVFLQFYREFPQTLRLSQADPEVLNGRDCAHEVSRLRFDLWKPVGDELIFTCDVSSEKDIYWALKVWLHAMATYQRESLSDEALGERGKPRLGVKGGAFLATFPGPDHQSTIPRDPDTETSGQDVVALNREALRGQRRHKVYLYDYFGPSIDTGFRVLGQCTARHFTVSLEVAFALASLHDQPGTVDYKDAGLVLLSSLPLKGVWGGNTYPLFAIDLKRDDDIFSAFSAFETERANMEKIHALCKACYASKNWPFQIYLPDSPNGHFTDPPADPLADYVAEQATKGAEGPADDEPVDAEEIDLDTPLE